MLRRDGLDLRTIAWPLAAHVRRINRPWFAKGSAWIIGQACPEFYPLVSSPADVLGTFPGPGYGDTTGPPAPSWGFHTQCLELGRIVGYARHLCRATDSGIWKSRLAAGMLRGAGAIWEWEQRGRDGRHGTRAIGRRSQFMKSRDYGVAC